jgi:hypothetical protein
MVAKPVNIVVATILYVKPIKPPRARAFRRHHSGQFDKPMGRSYLGKARLICVAMVPFMFVCLASEHRLAQVLRSSHK